MKKSAIILISFMILGMSQAYAQKGQMHQGKQMQKNEAICPNYPGGPQMMPPPPLTEIIPNLTEKQQEDIKALQTGHLKSMMTLHNQLSEKEAKYKSLSTAEKADLPAIHKIIEEMGAIKVNVMKEEASFKQSVRKLLDEEQKIFFDMHAFNNQCRGSHHGSGRGR